MHTMYVHLGLEAVVIIVSGALWNRLFKICVINPCGAEIAQSKNLGFILTNNIVNF